MRTAASLDTAYQQAARATEIGSKSFFFASRFFPPDVARSAHAVYWFSRHTDDLVDETPSPAEAAAKLDTWEAALRRAFDGEPASHPALAAFLDTLRQSSIPQEYPLELIRGMRMDLEQNRYRTYAELRVFCYRAASVVGLMMAHVIGFEGAAEKYAIDLGIAMQLTNILRDIGEDLGRGRIYLPLDELARFGYSEEDMLRRKRTAAFGELMRFQVQRAREHYSSAQPGIALLHRRGRFAVQVAADVYARILNRIEAMDYDVFHKRAVVPRYQKYLLTARSLALPAAELSLRRLASWRT